jgi:enoyl-CoA hydratase/carnithine racemase
MEALPSLLLEDRPAEGVVRLRLNRPQARNALNRPLRRALAEAFLRLADDDDARCVILCGNEKAFAAGADLKEMASLSPTDVWRLNVLGLWRAIGDFPKPVIAAVAGPALGGGCELAQHADIILAAESARFGQPEVKVGIMPGGGGTQRLMRAVGKYRALKLLMTGDIITGAEAVAMGLASELVADAELEARAVAMAAHIASMPSVAMRLLKQVALGGADAALATGLLLERRAFELTFDTADQKEGMQAFAERRPPKFSGR